MKYLLLLLLCLSSCGKKSPELGVLSEVAEAKPKKSGDFSRLAGWWKGDSLCLDLDLNGDVELSTLGERKKIIVGGASLDASTPGSLKLSVEKIWEARWVSRCREFTGGGDWIESQEVLGLIMKPSESVALTFSLKGDDALELCGSSCVTLQRNDSRLAPQWQHPDREKASPRFALEDVVGLELGTNNATLQVASSSSAFDALYGVASWRHLSGEEFSVQFTPQEGSAPLRVLGAKSEPGVSLAFTLKRLKGHQAELCLSTRCVKLNRYFDPDSYDP